MPTVRFAVEGAKPNEFCSDRWTAFTKSNDVYLLPKGVAGSLKISIHESGICRYALTEQLGAHQPPGHEEDRVILRWERGSTDEVLHTHVLSIIFVIVAGGRSAPLSDKKRTTKLACPLPGFASEVAVFMSETDPTYWKDKEFITKNIFANMQLPNGLYVTFRKRVTQFTNDEFQRVLSKSAALNQIHVGTENPEVMGSGPSETIIPIAWANHARFYHIAPTTSALLMGVKANWSTRNGTQFPDR